MTEFQREIRRKKRVIEYAEKNGNIDPTDLVSLKQEAPGTFRFRGLKW